MSHELGLALLVALLWGPTAIWLVYRAMRSHQGRLSRSITDGSEATRSAQTAADPVETLIGPEHFWVCETCHSLNRREAKRCYGCLAAREDTPRHAPSSQAANGWDPPATAGSSPAVPRGTGEATRGADGMAGGASTPAALTSGPPAPERPAAAAQPTAPEALRALPDGLTICPFLGLRQDPSTRYDFPDPRSFCHSPAGHETGSMAPLRRFVAGVTGANQAAPISMEHQRSSCLTAMHVQCARFPADRTAATPPAEPEQPRPSKSPAPVLVPPPTPSPAVKAPPAAKASPAVSGDSGDIATPAVVRRTASAGTERRRRAGKPAGPVVPDAQPAPAADVDDPSHAPRRREPARERKRRS